MSWVSTICRLW